jgi:lipopolysaccharide export system permease protein
VPPGDGPRTGGWMLSGTTTTPADIDAGVAPEVLESLSPGRFFLRTDVDFEKVTRQKNWWLCLSTWDLLRDLGKTEAQGSRLASLAVLFHTRLTRPFLAMILVILGLSVILRDQNRNLYISAGLCLVLCGLFFFACFFCKYLGEHEHLSPAMAAWLPVIVFGPLSFVMFDAVHT